MARLLSEPLKQAPEKPWDTFAVDVTHGLTSHILYIVVDTAQLWYLCGVEPEVNRDYQIAKGYGYWLIAVLSKPKPITQI